MDDMLSSKEIDDLLEFISTGEADTGCDRQEKSVRDYDFRRPDKFSRDQIRTVQMMHEIFARLTAAFLSKKLSVPAGVHVASVDQCTYAEFLRCIPDPATFCRSAATERIARDKHSYPAPTVDILFVSLSLVCYITKGEFR